MGKLYKTEYVIHKHIKSPRDIHYDLRFRVGNTVKSIFTRSDWTKLPNRKLVLQAPDHEKKWLNFEGTILSKRGKEQQLVIVAKGTMEIGVTKHNNLVLHFLTDTKGNMIDKVIVLVKTRHGEYLTIVPKNKKHILEQVSQSETKASDIEKVMGKVSKEKVQIT